MIKSSCAPTWASQAKYNELSNGHSSFNLLAEAARWLSGPTKPGQRRGRVTAAAAPPTMFGGDPFGGGDPFDDPFFTGGGGASREGGRRRDPFDAMRQMMGGGGLLGGGFGEDFGRGGGGGNGSFTMMSSSTTISGDGRSRTVTETAQRHGAGPVVGERREHNRERDRETLSCRRRIGDRARTVLKERDEHGDERTLDTIENMDADPQALDRFEDEFRSARAGRNNMLGYEQPSRRRRTPMIGPAYDFDQDEV